MPDQENACAHRGYGSRKAGRWNAVFSNRRSAPVGTAQRFFIRTCRTIAICKLPAVELWRRGGGDRCGWWLSLQWRNFASPARGDDEGRLASTPAIAKAELNRRGVALLVNALQLRLVILLEDINRTDIVAEKTEQPFRGIKGGKRDAGVVLDDGFAVGEEEVAHPAEAVLEHQI